MKKVLFIFLLCFTFTTSISYGELIIRSAGADKEQKYFTPMNLEIIGHYASKSAASDMAFFNDESTDFNKFKQLKIKLNDHSPIIIVANGFVGSIVGYKSSGYITSGTMMGNLLVEGGIFNTDQVKNGHSLTIYVLACNSAVCVTSENPKSFILQILETLKNKMPKEMPIAIRITGLNGYGIFNRDITDSLPFKIVSYDVRTNKSYNEKMDTLTKSCSKFLVPDANEKEIFKRYQNLILMQTI